MQNALMIDPRYSPYFGAQDMGSGSGTLGSGAGYDWMRGLSQLPGSESFYNPGTQAGDSSTDASIDQNALYAYLQAKGYNLNEMGVEGDQVERWISNATGQDVGARERIATDDQNFWIGAQLASAVVGNGVSEWAAAGNGMGGATGTTGNIPAGSGPSSGIPSGVEPGIGTLPEVPGANLANVGGGGGGLDTSALYNGGDLGGFGGAGPGGSPDLSGLNGIGGGGGYNQLSGFEGVGGVDYSQFGGGAGSPSAGPTSSPAASPTTPNSPATAPPRAGTSVADFLRGNAPAGDYMRAGSTLAGLYTTNRATDAANQGEANNLALLTRMYEDSKANNQPLLDLRNAQLPRINALMADPSSVTQEPGYQFGLKQGQDQINNSMAARGGYYSGQQMKASQKYGQDYAGTKLDQSLNRLMNVAGLGQQGATAQQNANTNYGQQGGQSMVNSGNNRGSGYIGYGNTLNNGVNNYMQDSYFDQMLNRKGP